MTLATDTNPSKKQKKRTTSDKLLPTEESTSPSNAAINHLSQHVASLPTVLRPLLSDPGKDIIRLLPKLFHHQRMISELQSNDKTPLSARFKFDLTGSTLISKSTPFTELKMQAEEILTDARESLKQIIIQVQILERDATKLQLFKNLIALTRDYVKGYCLWTDNQQYKDNLPTIAYLVRHALVNDFLKSFLGKTENWIMNTITTELGVAVVPNELITTLAQDISKVIKTTILDGLQAFVLREKHNEKALQIIAITNANKKETATATTAMELESPTQSEASIQSIVNDAVAKKTRSLQDQIRALKNKTRGANAGASSTNKKAESPAAVDSDSTKKPKASSKSKKQKKKGTKAGKLSRS